MYFKFYTKETTKREKIRSLLPNSLVLLLIILWGKKDDELICLWEIFNFNLILFFLISITERVLLTLFQQSYKGFNGKFFKICCNKHDPTLLDGFPLYWVEKSRLKKPRSLEDLASQDREVCEFFSNSGAVFSTVELIKLEYNPKALKGYIGTFFVSAFTCLYLHTVSV